MTTIGPVAGAPGRRARAGHPEPIFILSPPRSYSTVALALLAGHPRIYGFPELLVFANETVGDLVDADGAEARTLPPEYHRTRLSGVCRAIAQVHEGVQTEDAVARARAWLAERAGWPGPRVLEHLLERVNPLIGAEKSPDTVSSDETLARCLRAYPRARFIHLTRHPVTTQLSMHRQNQRYLTNMKVRRVGAASSWYLAHRRIMNALAELPHGQWIRLRGEDLLRDPVTWLRRLLGRLELDAGDDVIDRMLRTETWAFAGNGPSGRLYGGDHKFFDNPRPQPVQDPGPVSFDPDWGLPGEMCDRMTELAERLGYPAKGKGG